jgi:hypothetical protein
MKTANNPSGKPLTLRDLERMSGGWTYEHLRKAINEGRPVVSRKLNDSLCQLLGLPAEDMWRLALQEKKRRTVKRLGASPLADTDIRLAAAWPALSAEQRDTICQLATDLARTRSSQDASGQDTPSGSCYLVTVQRQVLVIAASEAAAREKAIRQAAGGIVTAAVRMADAVLLAS